MGLADGNTCTLLSFSPNGRESQKTLCCTPRAHKHFPWHHKCHTSPAHSSTPALGALHSHMEHSAWTLWQLRALQPSKLPHFLWILWVCSLVHHPPISLLKNFYLPIKFSSSSSGLVTEVTAERYSLHLDSCTPSLLTPWSFNKAVEGTHHIWECFIQATINWKPERKKDWFLSQIYTDTHTLLQSGLLSSRTKTWDNLKIRQVNF